jgi:hypothetical protein
MRFKIHYTLADGYEDSIIIEGDSIDQLRKLAEEEVEARGGTDPWSEEC